MSGKVFEVSGAGGFARLVEENADGLPGVLDIGLPDIQRDGPIPPRVRSSLFTLDTGPLAAGVYTGRITVAPRADVTLNVIRASAYLCDLATLANPLAARRTMDAGVLQFTSGLAGASFLTTANLSGGTLLSDGATPGLLCSADRLDEVAASARQLVTPRGLIIEGAGIDGGVGPSLTYQWSRNAVLAENDIACFVLHYLVVPRGCLPYAF